MTQLSWQPSKQQLEYAARAGGVVGRTVLHNGLWAIRHGKKVWSPLATTTQGKADLLDLILKCIHGMSHEFYVDHEKFRLWNSFSVALEVSISIGNDKHAALARAALEVAAQVGAKMRGEV